MTVTAVRRSCPLERVYLPPMSRKKRDRRREHILILSLDHVDYEVIACLMNIN